MKKQLRLLLTLLLLSVVSVGWAEEETIDFSAKGYANQEAIESVEGSAFSISFNKGSNSNAPKYYNTGAAIRVYGGNYFTVSSSNTITAITLTFSSGEGSNAITTNVGTFTSPTWSGSAQEVTFTIGGTSGHRRIKKITVTYTAGASDKQNANVSIGANEINVGGTTTVTTDGPALTLTSSNTNVATVSGNTISGVAAGITNITAEWAENDTYNGGSKTFTLTVKDADKGTESNPYTVAEALALINNLNGQTSWQVYVKGIVSGIVTAYNSQYGNISYNISDDGTTEANQLQAFRGLGLNGNQFTSENDLLAGDQVVVCGTLTMYNTTPEFAAGNYLVSLIRQGGKEAAGLAYEVTSLTKYTTDAAFTNPLTNPNGLTVSYDSSNPGVATVDANGQVTIGTAGTTTITATSAEDDTYYAGTASYTLTVKEQKTYEEGVLFDETFNSLEGTGGRDGSFSGNVGSGSMDKANFDEENWTWTSTGTGAAYQSVKLGTGSATGAITTRSIALNGNGTLTFSVAGWGDAKTNTLTVTATGGTLSGDTEVTATNGEWTTHSVTITGATGDLVLTFTMQRGFIDDIKVAEGAALPTVTPPTFSPAAGEVAYGTNVTITADEGCIISYTVDGTDPATSTTATMTEGNTATVSITQDLTIRAIALDGDANESSEATATYTVARPAAPVFTPAAGTVAAGTQVTITAEGAALIMYTTDGTTPSYANNVGEIYSTPITVNTTTTIKAIAIDDNELESEVASATYTVESSTPSNTVYRKVTATADLTDGEYLIVYEDGSLAFNGGLETLDAVSNTINVTIANDEIASNATVDAATFTIDMTAGTIKSKSGFYIGQNSNANGLASSETTAYTHNEISINEGDDTKRAEIVSSGGAFLRYNAASNQSRFRYYKSSSYASQQAIHLYKKVTESADVTMPVTKIGYASMYYQNVNLIVPAGVKASAYVVTNGKLTESKAYNTGDIIPAGTAVVIEALTPSTETQTFEFTATTEAGEAPTANMLYGSDTEITDDEAGYKYYILSTPKDDPNGEPGFYWQQGTQGDKVTSAPNKAYLKIPADVAAGAKGFTFSGETTGITTIDGNENADADGHWYTIDGQRLNTMPTQKGLYIHNGKKIVVK